MAEEKKDYVVYGMRAKCSEGTMENYISTDVGHGVTYQGQPLLNANDHTAQVNLTHFGDCNSKQIYEDAKKQADEKYKADADDGFFAKAGKWIAKTVTKAAINVQEHLMFHKCELDTPLPWMFCNEEHMIDGAPALTMESQCPCRRGGVITIVPVVEEVVAIETTEGTEVMKVAESADREFDVLMNEFIVTLQEEPNNFEKLYDLALQISSTDTANEIEEKVFSMFQPIITALFAFDYVQNKDDEPPSNVDFYHTMDNYGLQHIAGFCDLYDNLQWILGMDLETKIIVFTPEDSDVEYRLQFWKGSYGMGMAYGAEIGFYYRDAKFSEWFPYGDGNALAYYLCLDPDKEIRTVQNIYDVKTGKLLIKNDTASYIDDQTHFWNLAIRTEQGYTAQDLYVENVLYVDDEKIRKAMLEALRADTDLEVIEEKTKGNTIVVKFSQGETSLTLEDVIDFIGGIFDEEN